MSKWWPHRNSHRWHLGRLVQEKAASLPAGGLVLDAGAGHCPYRPFFSHLQYETADFCQVAKAYGSIDYVCDLRSVPVEDGRYDAVVCTQVLEHLAEPQAVLREFNRILKPNGQLYLSAPLCYDEHEQPYDFFRYTQFGLKHLLESAGFDVHAIDWVEGYFGTLAYQLKKASRSLPFRPRDYGGGIVGVAAAACSIGMRTASSLLSRWFSMLDVRHKYTAKGHCLNYCLSAVKAKEAARQEPLAA